MTCLCLIEPELSITCVSAADQHDRGVSIPLLLSWKLDMLSHEYVIQCMGEVDY